MRKNFIIVSYILVILVVGFSNLQAKETQENGRITREFTVTALALDAYNARLQTEHNEDTNETNTQGGLTE